MGSKSEIGVVLNYTYLHGFTAFYHLFLGRNVTALAAGKGLAALPSNADMAADEKKVNRKWEKVSEGCRTDPPFPAWDRLIYRKWLISRV